MAVELVFARSQEILTAAVPSYKIARKGYPDAALAMKEDVLALVPVVRDHHSAAGKMIIGRRDFPDAHFIIFFVNGSANVEIVALPHAIGENAVAQYAR